MIKFPNIYQFFREDVVRKEAKKEANDLFKVEKLNILKNFEEKKIEREKKFKGYLKEQTSIAYKLGLAADSKYIVETGSLTNVNRGKILFAKNQEKVAEILLGPEGKKVEKYPGYFPKGTVSKSLSVITQSNVSKFLKQNPTGRFEIEDRYFAITEPKQANKPSIKKRNLFGVSKEEKNLI